MTHLLGTAKHVATGVVTLPVRVAARAFGLARGAASAAASHRSGSSPAPSWQTADPVTPSEPRATEQPSPNLGTEPSPVNVTEELGLDPAPVDEPTVQAPRTPPVTKIDAEAEPGLVDSTPADVAARIARQD